MSPTSKVCFPCIDVFTDFLTYRFQDSFWGDNYNELVAIKNK